MFSRKPDETDEEALAQCYPRLLSTRERLYGRYAHVAIDYYERNDESFGVDEFLSAIEGAVGKQ
jgi:tRNA isopentenyl-2-thiomethyl-A-37 hydroxylase MiaE